MRIRHSKSLGHNLRNDEVSFNMVEDKEIATMSYEKYLELLRWIAEKDEELQKQVILAIGSEQVCWEDDTIHYTEIESTLGISRELIEEVQCVIGEDMFRGIGEFCALSPLGWLKYEELDQNFVDNDSVFPWADCDILESDGSSDDKAIYGWENLELQFKGYIMGYKQSADIIIEGALNSTRNSIKDTTIYPIFFLYHHFVELAIKNMLRFFIKYKGIDNTIDIKNKLKKAGHNIGKLWNLLYKYLIEEFEEEEEKQIIKNAGNYIMQLHELDKYNVRFRYPLSMKGERTQNRNKIINIARLRNRMDELYNFFDVAFMELDRRLVLRSEYLEIVLAIEKEFSEYYPDF